MSRKYHGPDPREIAELNALPKDQRAWKEMERKKVSTTVGLIRLFLLFLAIYFAGGALYQSVIEGVFLNPALHDYKRGHTKAAQAEFQDYLRWGGTEPSAHYYLGIIYVSEGRKTDAIDQFSQDTSGTPVRNQEEIRTNARSKAMIRAVENSP
jgi:TolA-binding protein